MYEGATSLDVLPSPKFQLIFCALAMAGRSKLKGEHTESFPRSNEKFAPGCTVTVLVAVSKHPRSSVAMRVTVNTSVASSATNTILGLSSLEALPFPKFQSKASAFELLLPNWLTKGSHPLSKSALKSAMGCGFTKTSAVAPPVHPFSVCAENVTVAVINSSELFSHVYEGATSLDVLPSPKFHDTFSSPVNSGMVKVSGEQAESTSKARSTSTVEKAVTVSVAVSVQPSSWVTVRVTSKSELVPLLINSWNAFSEEDVSPFPKSQANSFARAVSLRNVTASGSQPAMMSAVNSTEGEGLTCNNATAIPPQPCCVSASKVMIDAVAAFVSFSQMWVGPFSVEEDPSPKFQSKLNKPS